MALLTRSENSTDTRSSGGSPLGETLWDTLQDPLQDPLRQPVQAGQDAKRDPADDAEEPGVPDKTEAEAIGKEVAEAPADPPAEGEPEPPPDLPPVEGSAGPVPQERFDVQKRFADRGSTESLTGTLPVPPTTYAAWTRREPDQLVDAYMHANWVDTEFEQKRAAFGITPEGLGTELDHIIPPDADPGVRKGINIGVAVGAGIIDMAVVSLFKSIPGVGILGHALTTVRGIWGAVENAKKLDGDPVPAILTILRSLLDFVGSSAGNLSDTCSLITGGAGALAGVTGGASVPVAGAAEAVGKALDIVGLVTDGGKLALSAINTVYNVVRAEVAEANGQYELADQYRDNALTSAIFTIVDTLSVIGDVVGLVGTNLIPAEVGENVTEQMAKQITKGGGKKLAVTLLKTLGKAGAAGAAGGVKGAVGYSAHDPDGDMNIVSDILATVGLGSSLTTGLGRGIYAMRVEGLDGVVGAEEGDVLQAAWGKTRTKMASARDMSVNDPMWTQEVLNTIMEPPGIEPLAVFESLLAPTTMFAGINTLLRKAGLGVGDASQIFDGIGVLADGLDSIGQPLLDGLVDQISGWKDGIGGFTEGIEKSLGEQKLSMEMLRNGMAGLQGVMGQVDALADSGGMIHEEVLKAVGFMNGLKGFNPDLPWWLKWMWNLLVVPFNWAIDGARSGLEYLAGEAREAIDIQVGQVVGWFRQQLGVLERALAEGGSVEKMLELAQAAVVAKVTEFRTTLESVDLQDLSIKGAVDWLRSVQQQVPWSESAAERMKGWQAFVAVEGQGEVDHWRATWGDDVRYAFQWHVEDYEMSAVTEVYQETRDGLSAIEAAGPDGRTQADVSNKRTALEISYKACQTAAGMKPVPMKLQRATMQAFWAAARDIAVMHRGLRGVAQPTGAKPFTDV